MDNLPLSERVVGKILANRARRFRDEPFIYTQGEWLTYDEVNCRANRVANGFSALGIGKGSRVAILSSNRQEYLDLWFGLSKIGAIQVPISCEYKSTQIRQALQRSTVDLLVLESAMLSEWLTARVKLATPPRFVVLPGDPTMDSQRSPESVRYADVIASASDADPEGVAAISGADPGAIMNTSGTTGPSKGVVLTHAQQYILGRNIAQDMRLTKDDVYYNCFPLHHNTAQAMITLPTLLVGARMVLTERFSASRFWSDIRELRCTAFYYIGETLRILLVATNAAEARDTPLRIGWGIGASAADRAEFKKRAGCDLRTGYGSTEANVPCFLPPNGAPERSAGRPIGGFELRIANEQGEPVVAGVHGEILVRASEPNAVMCGYDNDPVATVEAWRDLWLHTGDIGYLDDDGHLFFVARLRDAIRVRGENVSAFEVEALFSQFNGILEVAAIAVPSELGGDDLKIVVVCDPRVLITPQELIEWAEPLLPRSSLPRYIEFVDALPKTSTNKVQKHVLRHFPFTDQTWRRVDGDAGRCSQQNHREA